MDLGVSESPHRSSGTNSIYTSELRAVVKFTNCYTLFGLLTYLDLSCLPADSWCSTTVSHWLNNSVKSPTQRWPSTSLWCCWYTFTCSVWYTPQGAVCRRSLRFSTHICRPTTTPRCSAAKVRCRCDVMNIFNAVVTCEIKLFWNYFGLCLRPSEIILFRRSETCLRLSRNYFAGLLRLTNIFQHVQCRWNNFSGRNNFMPVSDVVACEIKLFRNCFGVLFRMSAPPVASCETKRWNNFKIIAE